MGGNITLDLKETRWENLGRIYLTQWDRRRKLAKMAANLRVPQNAGNSQEGLCSMDLRNYFV